MYEWLRVSKSGYYEWRGNPGSATAKRREEIKLYITKAFEDSDGTYGNRRVHAQPLRWGVECGDEFVRALMRELGLVPCQVAAPVAVAPGWRCPGPRVVRAGWGHAPSSARSQGA